MKKPHHCNRKKIPQLPPLTPDEAYNLASIVAPKLYLPDSETVKKFGGPIFPAVRNQNNRVSPLIHENITVGMNDDNTTPRWALLWSHGIPGKSQKITSGWTIAHVWDRSKEINAYTNLANLALLPEWMASLSDKDGPLTDYLRYHAFKVYGWKPSGEQDPKQPQNYDRIQWQYLDLVNDPVAFVKGEFAPAKCKRSKILKPLMPQRLGGDL